jgi:hypothetical protein
VAYTLAVAAGDGHAAVPADRLAAASMVLNALWLLVVRAGCRVLVSSRWR